MEDFICTNNGQSCPQEQCNSECYFACPNQIPIEVLSSNMNINLPF